MVDSGLNKDLEGKRVANEPMETIVTKYPYKSASSSSGNGNAVACSISCWYCCINCSSTWTSGGAKAGEATNSNCGLPANFLANHKNGFSKL